MNQDELDKLFDRYLADPTTGSNIVDLELRKIVAGLGKSVLLLNKSSTRLARVNIGLAVVMVLAGIAQVIVAILRR